MAFQISIIEITENSRVVSLHEELDESLEAFNQLINQRDWQPEDAAVSLTDITNNKRYDESTKFQVSYQMMNASRKYRYFKPCFKHYLTSQVEGNMAYIPPQEWEIATFLPVAQWNKGNMSQVYRDSRSMI